MASPIILGILELIAIGSCGYGMYFLYFAGVSILGMIYNGLWFILGFAGNVCGITALAYMYYEDDEEYMLMSQYFVQYHYLCAWLTIVIGYPSVVTQAWMTHYPSPFVHLHGILSVIPMIAWIQRKTSNIVLTTQLVTAVSIFSHFYISLLAMNIWGMAGAGLMILNVIALSLPTRYNSFGFSSREMYVIGLAVTSYVFCLAFEQTTKHPKVVKNLFPWWIK